MAKQWLWQLTALFVKEGSGADPLVAWEGVAFGESSEHATVGAAMQVAAVSPPGAVSYEVGWRHWGWQVETVRGKAPYWYPLLPREPLLCPAVAGLAIGQWSLAPWTGTEVV